MNANQFLGAVGGVDKLTSGMTGTVGDQTWRLGEAEKFKEGSIWKGNRRKGVRYTIDWGTAGAMNPAAPAGPENNPLAGNSTPMGPQGQIIDPAITGNQGTPVLDAKGNQITSDGSNMMFNSGNMPTLSNPNAGAVPTQAPPVNPMSTGAATVTGGSGMNAVYQPEEFPSLSASQVNTADQSLVSPAATNVINPSTEVNAVDQSVTAQGQAPAQTVTRPKQRQVQVQKPVNQQRNTAPVKNSSVAYQQKIDELYAQGSYSDEVEKYIQLKAQAETREAKEKKQQAKQQQEAANAVKIEAERKAQEKREKEYRSRANVPASAYGGNVDPIALENAVALINRAFGGMIPKANNGMDLGSQDTNGNGIPDYLEAENLPANQPNPFDKSGTIEESNAKKLNIDWNAAGDVYMNAAAKVTNFANRMNAMNPERDMAKFSALNRPSNTYDTMKQGLYDQAGNFIPNDIGNQVLNPTDTMYNNQRQIFAYGGRVYEIGGEVDLDDNEMEQLAAVGFKFSKV
jgi:hypothetical protein